MDILFHIGMAKTGSSALQTALHGSADYLASRAVLYPRDPERPGSRTHRLFATQAAPIKRLPRHMTDFGPQEAAMDRFAAWQAHVRREIATLRPKLLLLSAETMYTRIDPAYARRLRAAFDGLGGAEPVFAAYARRPSERYVSALQQALRRSAKVRQPRRLDWRPPVADYEALFGEGCVRLHLFHRGALHDGDVVADFSTRYLAPYGVTPQAMVRPGEVNVSIGAESMAILRAFRADFHGDRDMRLSAETDALREALRAADRAVGAHRPRLRPEVAEMVDYASDIPLWLRDRHGVVFPDFDYRRLERGRFAGLPGRTLALDEIVVIDPGTLRAVLEHLLASQWAPIWRIRRRRWLHAFRRRVTG